MVNHAGNRPAGSSPIFIKETSAFPQAGLNHSRRIVHLPVAGAMSSAASVGCLPDPTFEPLNPGGGLLQGAQLLRRACHRSTQPPAEGLTLPTWRVSQVRAGCWYTTDEIHRPESENT